MDISELREEFYKLISDEMEDCSRITPTPTSTPIPPRPTSTPIPPRPTSTPTSTPTPRPTQTALPILPIIPPLTPTPTPTLTPPPMLLTPTPTPTSTPTPVPTPTLSQVEQLLKQAESYFERRQYTTPKERNAFDFYKQVLQLEPSNRHARKKIGEMVALYKSLGDKAYDQENFPRAKKFYQRYLLVAEYILITLNDQSIQQQEQEVQNTLEVLLLKEKSQQLRSIVDQNIEKFEQLEQEGSRVVNVPKRIILVLEEIIENFEELEAIYMQFPQDADRVEIINRLKINREEYERKIEEWRAKLEE